MKFRFRREISDYEDNTYVYYFYVDGKQINRWTIFSYVTEGEPDYTGFIRSKALSSNNSLVQVKKAMVEEYCKRNGVEKL